MKTNYSKFAIISICLVALSTVAFADVKIKSKQTSSGQTFENTTFIKGKRQRTESMNGLMVNITQCDLRRGLQVNPNAKTYLVNPFDDLVETTTSPVAGGSTKDGLVRAGGTVTTTITTKDTGECRQMFGFTAKHLITTMETASSPDACAVNNSKMEFDGWYIDAEFALDCDQSQGVRNYQSGIKAGCQDKYQMKQIGTAKRSYPVYEKMSMFDGNGKESFSTVNEVVELSKATLDASLFDVPADFREVSDTSAMYASSTSNSSTSIGKTTSGDSGLSQNIKNMSQSSADTSSDVGAKKAGVVRIGLANVKVSAVGEGLSAAELSGAIQSSMTEYLKTPGVELVQLESKLFSAITSEASEKECDYVLFATASHKKGGGGGFGMFGKVISSSIGQTGIGQTGSTAGNIAGNVATNAIISADTVSGNTKSKDEISIDINLQKVGTSVFAKQFKAKAKSNGEDILSPMIEAIAKAILTTAK